MVRCKGVGRGGADAREHLRRCSTFVPVSKVMVVVVAAIVVMVVVAVVVRAGAEALSRQLFRAAANAMISNPRRVGGVG